MSQHKRPRPPQSTSSSNSRPQSSSSPTPPSSTFSFFNTPSRSSAHLSANNPSTLSPLARLLAESSLTTGDEATASLQPSLASLGISSPSKEDGKHGQETIDPVRLASTFKLLSQWEGTAVKWATKDREAARRRRERSERGEHNRRRRRDLTPEEDDSEDEIDMRTGLIVKNNGALERLAYMPLGSMLYASEDEEDEEDEDEEDEVEAVKTEFGVKAKGGKMDQGAESEDELNTWGPKSMLVQSAELTPHARDLLLHQHQHQHQRTQPPSSPTSPSHNTFPTTTSLNAQARNLARDKARLKAARAEERRNAWGPEMDDDLRSFLREEGEIRERERKRRRGGGRDGRRSESGSGSGSGGGTETETGSESDSRSGSGSGSSSASGSGSGSGSATETADEVSDHEQGPLPLQGSSRRIPTAIVDSESEDEADLVTRNKRLQKPHRRRIQSTTPTSTSTPPPSKSYRNPSTSARAQAPSSGSSSTLLKVKPEPGPSSRNTLHAAEPYYVDLTKESLSDDELDDLFRVQEGVEEPVRSGGAVPGVEMDGVESGRVKLEKLAEWEKEKYKTGGNASDPPACSTPTPNSTVALALAAAPSPTTTSSSPLARPARINPPTRPIAVKLEGVVVPLRRIVTPMQAMAVADAPEASNDATPPTEEMSVRATRKRIVANGATPPTASTPSASRSAELDEASPAPRRSIRKVVKRVISPVTTPVVKREVMESTSVASPSVQRGVPSDTPARTDVLPMGGSARKISTRVAPAPSAPVTKTPIPRRQRSRASSVESIDPLALPEPPVGSMRRRTIFAPSSVDRKPDIKYIEAMESEEDEMADPLALTPSRIQRSPVVPLLAGGTPQKAKSPPARPSPIVSSSNRPPTVRRAKIITPARPTSPTTAQPRHFPRQCHRSPVEITASPPEPSRSILRPRPTRISSGHIPDHTPISVTSPRALSSSEGQQLANILAPAPISCASSGTVASSMIRDDGRSASVAVSEMEVDGLDFGLRLGQETASDSARAVESAVEKFFRIPDKERELVKQMARREKPSPEMRKAPAQFSLPPPPNPARQPSGMTMGSGPTGHFASPKRKRPISDEGGLVSRSGGMTPVAQTTWNDGTPSSPAQRRVGRPRKTDVVRSIPLAKDENPRSVVTQTPQRLPRQVEDVFSSSPRFANTPPMSRPTSTYMLPRPITSYTSPSTGLIAPPTGPMSSPAMATVGGGAQPKRSPRRRCMRCFTAGRPAGMMDCPGRLRLAKCKYALLTDTYTVAPSRRKVGMSDSPGKGASPPKVGVEGTSGGAHDAYERTYA